jgi:hypothetical protein
VWALVIVLLCAPFAVVTSERLTEGATCDVGALKSG